MSKEALNLIYGPPASGKSSVVKEIKREHRFEYLSTGDVTRREIANMTPCGLALKQCLDDVVEYPTDLISSLMERKITDLLDSGTSIILDGYPKYPNEAEAFVEFLKKRKINVLNVIVIQLSLNKASDRVADRRICSSCSSQIDSTATTSTHECPGCGGELIIREDDKPEIFKRRYQDHTSSIDQTLEVLRPYCDTIQYIDGNQDRGNLNKVILVALKPG